MLRNFALLVAVSWASHASAISLVGVTHIDYYPEGYSGQFCCDGVAIYSLDYLPGPTFELDYFSIIDYQNRPVYTIHNLTGLEVTVIEHEGKDYLRLYGFPELETTINPDMGENVYTEFGYSFIELPTLAAVGVPEPTGLVMAAVGLGCLLLYRKRG